MASLGMTANMGFWYRYARFTCPVAFGCYLGLLFNGEVEGAW